MFLTSRSTFVTQKTNQVDNWRLRHSKNDFYTILFIDYTMKLIGCILYYTILYYEINWVYTILYYTMKLIGCKSTTTTTKTHTLKRKLSSHGLGLTFLCGIFVQFLPSPGRYPGRYVCGGMWTEFLQKSSSLKHHVLIIHFTICQSILHANCNNRPNSALLLVFGIIV